jgi:biopolymer transport protein ExbB/TolQ
MNQTFSRESVFQMFALVIAVIVVHAVYVAVIYPNADAILAQQFAAMRQDPNYIAPATLYVTIKDFEPETCIVLSLWALAIIGYKWRTVTQERRLLQQQLLPIPEGVRILPEDTREYARQIQALPEGERALLLPRALLHALRRFGATRSLQDTATSTHMLVASEAERLDSELAMIRFIVWAIPAIGFVGTVRGIGIALRMAHRAVEGDVTTVTQFLGSAFNSTLIALLTCITLMFLVHQLQLIQERLAYEAEAYCDEHLISHLHAG